MKKTKKLISFTAAMAASAILAVPSSAYLTVYENGARELASNNGTWKVTFDMSHTDDIAKTEKMYLVVSITDTGRYEEEKSAGYYITDEPAETDENGEELPPPEFADFQGQFGVSAAEWYEFSYAGFDEKTPTETELGVKKIGDGKYLLIADLKARGIEYTEFGTSASIGEWGNSSPNYTLSVEEFFLCGEDKVIVYYDSLGNADYDHPMPDYDLSVTSAPAETEAAPAETTSAAETAAPAGGETAETSGTAETTAAPSSGTVQSSASEDFGSRDMTLVIVGIAAGVIIIAVIVALIIVMAKKKR